MGTAQGIIDVARSYLGMTEDDPRFVEMIDYYNEHTDGYDMTLWDEWCACFASVCSIKSGNAHLTGTSVNCATFRSIWREKGIYRERWETPKPGWFIDYDWQQDGIPDHIGIVVDCDGSTIHVIEGNTDGEMCAEHWIPVRSWSISCFGAPDYEEDDMPSAREIAEAIWNYEYKGHTMAERLYLANYADYRTDDASGRDPAVEATDHERICHMAKKQAEEIQAIDNIDGMVKAIAEALAPKEADKAVKGDE